MPRTIVIDPVTRLEGHAKITLLMNDRGEVESARFHVTQLRGFEKFCEGRPFYEMPALMSRICGICPVSHLLTSAKACDAILAVRIPPAAAKLRRVLNLAQIIQSHALSFFYLSSPDLLLGMESDPAKRNLFGAGKSGAWPGRHSLASIRAAGDRVARRKANSSGMGGSRRSQRAAFDRTARPYSLDDSGGHCHCAKHIEMVQDSV